MRISLFTVILATILFISPAWGNTHHTLTMRSVTLYSGSLKNNITRIAKAFGWNKVVWNVPEDYNWIGTTTLHSQSIVKMMQKILNNFPLQARFYEGNHILAIAPRTL